MKNNKLMIFVSFALIVLVTSSIINCRAMIYEVKDTDAKKIKYIDDISVAMVDILIETEDSSLRNLKDEITDYVLGKFPSLETYCFPDKILIAQRDTTSLVYNFSSGNSKSDQMLDGELEKEEEEEEKEEKETQNTPNNQQNENDNNLESQDEAQQNNNYSDITNKPQDYDLINIEDVESKSNIGEILGKDPAEILEQEHLTYNLKTPGNLEDTGDLEASDFKNGNEVKLLSKLMNIQKDIVVSCFVKITDKDIYIKIAIANNILLQIPYKVEFKIDLEDYLMDNVNLEKLVWNEIKKFFYSFNIATLEIVTNINNALIYIDGEFYGRTKKADNGKYTNKFVNIMAGSHKIRVVKDGYKQKEGFIFLHKDKNSVVNVDLEKLSSDSDVLIYTDVPGADIWIDMNYVGKTPDDVSSDNPFVIENVEEGIHKIRVEKEGFNPFVKKIEVDGTSNEEFPVKLSGYDEKAFDPDYRSSKFAVCSDIFIYGSLLSLGATIGIYYQFHSYDDELYAYESSDPRYSDIRNNRYITQTFVTIFSSLTVLMIVGAITFKWIELEKRNIQIGDSGGTAPVGTAIYVLPKDDSIALGFNLSYYF